MISYQYRKSHCGDKTILRPSYLHNGISYTAKMTSLYWIRVQTATSHPSALLFSSASLPTTISHSKTSHFLFLSASHPLLCSLYIFPTYLFLTYSLPFYLWFFSPSISHCIFHSLFLSHHLSLPVYLSCYLTSVHLSLLASLSRSFSHPLFISMPHSHS